MDQEMKMFAVKNALIPEFYQKFHCLADKCRDNCCMGWEIGFDKKDYLRLRRLEAPDELKERLEKGVRRLRGGERSDERMYGRFELEGNEERCPFLDRDGLCAIQRGCGHEVLPLVCTSFPRRIFHSPAAKEYSLSPSCEGVLELLWELPEGVRFIEEPLPKKEHRAVEDTPGENLLKHYAAIRRILFDILQNRSMSLTQRMLYLGMTLQRLQKEDWTNFDPDKWGAQTAALTGLIKGSLDKITGNREMYILQNLKVLNVISRTEKKDWIKEVFEALEVEHNIAFAPDENGEPNRKLEFRLAFSQDCYEEALAEFESAFSGRGYFFENLMAASALYLSFPSLKGREELWRSYVTLCNLYSLYRFVAVSGCKGKATKERLFHMIAMTSRSTLHNRDRFQGFREEFFENDSSTLAHMAILLEG